jgi:hypothetical protein
MAHRCCSSGLWIEDGMSYFYAFISGFAVFCVFLPSTVASPPAANAVGLGIATFMGITAIILAIKDV